MIELTMMLIAVVALVLLVIVGGGVVLVWLTLEETYFMDGPLPTAATYDMYKPQPQLTNVSITCS